MVAATQTFAETLNGIPNLRWGCNLRGS